MWSSQCHPAEICRTSIIMPTEKRFFNHFPTVFRNKSVRSILCGRLQLVLNRWHTESFADRASLDPTTREQSKWLRPFSKTILGVYNSLDRSMIRLKHRNRRVGAARPTGRGPFLTRDASKVDSIGLRHNVCAVLKPSFNRQFTEK